MRVKVLVLGTIAAFALAAGVLLSSPGAAFASNEGGNNGGCSAFGQFMPPATPGAGIPGEIISDAARDGIHLVSELKEILCPAE